MTKATLSLIKAVKNNKTEQQNTMDPFPHSYTNPHHISRLHGPHNILQVFKFQLYCFDGRGGGKFSQSHPEGYKPRPTHEDTALHMIPCNQKCVILFHGV